MELNVSTRIFGGFLLVLGLSAIIFLTAIIGIANINGSIEDVTEKSVPMQSTGADLMVALLESDIALFAYFNAAQPGEIKLSEEQYNKHKKSNLKIQTQLKELTQDQVVLAEELSKTISANNGFFKAADQAILQRQTANQLQSQVTVMASDFTDLADEMLSYSYDLEGVASSDASLAIISELTNQIENTVSAANASLSSNIKFEVLGNQSLITGMIGNIEQQLSQLASDGSMGGSEELASMQQTFSGFKPTLAGEGNVQALKLKAIEAKSAAKKNLQIAQTQAVAAKKSLKDFNLKLVEYTETIKNEASSTVVQTQSVIVALALLVVAVSLGVSFWVTRSIRVPLDNAVRNIQKVSGGDLTVDFGKASNDELGVLTSNMQGLVNSLRSILHDISDSSNQLATTAEETTAISNQSYDSVMKGKEQSHLVMSSIREMAESVGMVSQSINQTLEAVETAHDEVTSGDKLLNQNIHRIGSLAQAIESAADVISKLNEETSNIETVLEVIRGVAEQTNLLALNAAIEAARAGEQGRGFAVVADEVRTLASRTHDSTEEIQELIQRLLDGSKAAVKTMSHSQEETQQCVSGINEVGSMLTSISGSIDQIKDMSQSIASAAEEQTASANEQTDNVQVIVDLSEVTASSAEENREASQSLATMAEKQRELVGRFTV